MIIDVQCEDSVILARIVQEAENAYNVNFLEKIRSGLFQFSHTVEAVSKDSVSGFYDVEKLEDTGLYTQTVKGYELVDDSDDEDYHFSDESSSDDDVSLFDEEEEEEEA